MLKVDGILETALYVDDVQRSVEFYRHIFGFQLITDAQRLVALEVSDRQILLLCGKGTSANLPSSSHDGAGRLHVAFAIPARDLEAWEAWLVENEIEIEEKKVWDKGGTSLYFRDPDHHCIEVATPGVWPRVY